MKKIVLPFVCCLATVLLAGCAPASVAPASTSLPGSSSPASLSQPADEATSASEPAASEAPEWTDEAVMELFLAQEQNARRTVLDCVAVPGRRRGAGGRGAVRGAGAHGRAAGVSLGGRHLPADGHRGHPRKPSGLAYLGNGEGRFRLDILDENGQPSGQIITFRREGVTTYFAVEPEKE